MFLKNIFTKGINTDIDNSMRQPDQWDYPSLNIRVINRKGQGLIITNFPGNSEEYTLPSNNVVIGSAEHNGILYILSHNSSGVGEIGTFPRPQAYTSGSTGFVSEYYPLMNYDDDSSGSDPVALRASEFNLSTEHPADIVINPSYDGSVDLVIADHYNPNRIINSNFDREGRLLTRYYTPSSFSGAMNQIASTSKIMEASFDSIEFGGNLKPGNYFLFFKYATENFNTTHFVDELGPIPIFFGSTARGIEGMQERDWVTNIENTTDKAIRLNFQKLDTTYAYLKIGVVRLSSLVENSTAEKDVYLISDNFKIPKGGNLSVKITGYETTEILTFSEIVSQRLPYNISKSIAALNNVLYGLNWKKSERTYDRDKFAEMALKITASATYSPSLGENYNTTAPVFESGDRNPIYFKKEENVLKYTGYMHGEVYPFGIQGIFSDGTETAAFPIMGNYGTSSSYLRKGLFLFPSWRDEGLSHVDGNGFYENADKTLGIQFHLQNAIDYIAANASAFEDIIGIRIVRGDRFENLICQGLGLPAFDGINIPHGGAFGQIGFGVDDNYTPGQNVFIPLNKGMFPYHHANGSTNFYKSSKPDGWTPADPTIGASTYGSVGLSNYEPASASFPNGRNRYFNMGLFSPDIMLQSYVNMNEEVWVERIHVAEANDTAGQLAETGNGHIVPEVIATEEASNTAIGKPGLKPSWEYPVKVKAHLIDNHVNRGPGKYSSYLTATDLFWEPATGNKYYARTMDIQRYIGLTRDDGDEWPFTDDFGNHYYFNVYRNNPDEFQQTISETFNPALSAYEPISEIFDITLLQKDVTCFRGDVFLQKSFFRTHRWWGYQNPNTDGSPAVTPSGDGSEWVDDGPLRAAWYQHGLMLGIHSENFINAELRNKVPFLTSDNVKSHYNFFPKSIEDYTTIANWVALRDIDEALVEALQVNDGYNQVTSQDAVIGNDPDIQEVADEARPFRLYHTNKHNPGSISNAFRDIGLSDFIDLDARFGHGTKVIEFKDQIFTVQEHAINQHYIKERITESDESGNIILASSTSLLPAFYRKLADFGSQHMRSIVKTKRGVWGVSWLDNIIWKILTGSSSSGNTTFGVSDITETLMIKSHWDDIKAEISSSNNIMSELSDNPLNGSGIVSGFNLFDNHLYITILSEQDGRSTNNNRTSVFNDMLDIFTGELPFSAYHYASIREDFFSFNRAFSEKGYKHNDFNRMQEFYGIKYPMILSFVVNGLQGGESNFTDLEKIFSSLRLEMNQEDLTQIIYETESQYSVYSFSKRGDPKYWEHSEYVENEWQIPMSLQTVSKQKQYNSNSDVRGRWVKISLFYNPDEPKEVYIKRVLTEFQQSEN